MTSTTEVKVDNSQAKRVYVPMTPEDRLCKQYKTTINRYLNSPRFEVYLRELGFDFSLDDMNSMTLASYLEDIKFTLSQKNQSSESDFQLEGFLNMCNTLLSVKFGVHVRALMSPSQELLDSIEELRLNSVSVKIDPRWRLAFSILFDLILSFGVKHLAKKSPTFPYPPAPAQSGTGVECELPVKDTPDVSATKLPVPSDITPVQCDLSPEAILAAISSNISKLPVPSDITPVQCDLSPEAILAAISSEGNFAVPKLSEENKAKFAKTCQDIGTTFTALMKEFKNP
jgi:hypothetical protein